MRCIVHIRKSLDYPGMHYVLRLVPTEPEADSGRRAETFTSLGQLSRRLIDMGLPEIYMGRGFANLRAGLDAAWSNIEIARDTFEHFGRIERRQVAA